MKRIIALACLVVSFVLPATAFSQSGGNILTNADGGVCIDSKCQEDLRQCEQDLGVTTKSAEDVAEQLKRCQAQLTEAKKEVVKKTPPPPIKKTVTVPPTPATCVGAHIHQVGSHCECDTEVVTPGKVVLSAYLRLHSHKDGTEACVLRAEWVDRFMGLEDRVNKIPGTDGTAGDLRVIWMVLRGTTAPIDADELKKLGGEHGSVLQWLENIEGQLKTLREKSAQYDKAFDVLCPPIEGNPEATLEERCKARPVGGEGGSRLTLEIGAEGRLGYRPGAKGNAGGDGYLNLVYTFPRSSWGYLLGGYVGGLNDKDTGPQYLWGLRTGPRVKLHDVVKLDMLLFVEQYYSTHGAGFGADRSVGFQGLQDKGMGFATGVNPRLVVCTSKGSALCFVGGVQLGYSPGIDRISFRLLEKDSGVVVTGTLGLHYSWDMF